MILTVLLTLLTFDARCGISPAEYASRRSRLAAFADTDTAFAVQCRGIGVRIKDDEPVTERGSEVLTSGIPQEPAAVRSSSGAGPRSGHSKILRKRLSNRVEERGDFVEGYPENEEIVPVHPGVVDFVRVE